MVLGVLVPVLGVPVPVVLRFGLPLLSADNFPVTASVTVVTRAVSGRAVLAVMLFSTAVAARVVALCDLVHFGLLLVRNELELCFCCFSVMGFFHEVLKVKAFSERFNPQGFIRPSFEQDIK